MADQQSNHTDTTEREALERLLSDANAEPIQISYQFVKSITKNFSEVIGRGGFGEVYLGFHRNEKKVAVKKIFGSQDFSDKPFLDEINCLMMVKHKNIVRFLAYCAETKEKLIKHEDEGRFILADVRQRFLCFEYVPNGNLDAYLKDNCRGDDWQTRYQMIIGVCHGLNYLHQKRINHLDLKPENILLDALLEPKITDFGVSRFLSEGRSRIITKSIVGTFGYIAPEILQNGEISFKADVYSLGSIIIKLLTGHDKYDYKNWHKSLDTENPQLKSCMEIARNCRHDDQHKRPSISEIICQLKDMESITENGSSVNHELRHGQQLSSIYQADYWREISLKMFSMETNTEQAPGNAQVIPNQNNPGQASADNTAQIGHAWQEEIHQMIKSLKDQYFAPLIELFNKISVAIHQVDSIIPPQRPSEEIERMKSFKIMLENILIFLHISKSAVQPALRDKLPQYEKDIIIILKAQTRKPGSKKREALSER